MGADASKDDSQKHKGLALFDNEEKKRLEKLFRDLSSPHVKEKNVVEYLDGILPPAIAKRVFHVMAHFGLPLPLEQILSYVTKNAFITALVHIFKGTFDEQARIIRWLASTHPTKNMHASELHQFVQEIFSAYFRVNELHNKETMETWKCASINDYYISQLVNFALCDLFYPDRKKRLELKQLEIPDVSYSDDDLSKWISNTFLFTSAFHYVFEHAFTVCSNLEKSLIPLGVDKKWVGTDAGLLNYAWLVAINQALPKERRSLWRLLFSARQHGESFTNLLRCIKHQSHTLIIVKDEDNHIFGGYSSAVWKNHPSFQGSQTCFLFSLEPTLNIYRPTGLNDNYFYLNTGQETLPNGMGMGGQLNYFGLWLDCEYGIGHSMAKPLSTTYHSPTLSGKPHFKYNDLEVWRVCPVNEEDEEYTDVEEKSILDKDPEARALLELIGRGTHSEGLRESDPQASSPEEHEKPHS